MAQTQIFNVATICVLRAYNAAKSDSGRPGLPPRPHTVGAYSAPRPPSWFKGPLRVGEGRENGKGGGRERGKEEAAWREEKLEQGRRWAKAGRP